MKVTRNITLALFLNTTFMQGARGESPVEKFLKPTAYLDIGNQKIVEMANKITAGLVDPKAKAIAIHDFVRDEIKFGFSKSFWKQKASEVLAEKKGFCNTKSTLFVALLRAAGIPAKQVFVTISASILEGFIDPNSTYVDHSYVEVFIDNRWIKTDSYIVDRQLFVASQKALLQQNKKLGLGTVVGASSDWDGSSDSFSQFLPALVENLSTVTYGEYDDVGDFYDKRPDSMNGSWLNRFIFNFVAGSTNKKIQALRVTQ